MGRYIAKRFVYLFAVLIFLTFILFCIYRLMPANRAYTDARTEFKAMARSIENLSSEEKDAVFDEIYLRYQRLYGTDVDNSIILYLRWIGFYPLYDGTYNGMLQGNLGFSYDYNLPVQDVIKAPIRNSMLLGLFTEICVLGVTIPLGIVCATKKGKAFDRTVQEFSLIGFSTPNFIIYILFIVFFCSILKIFPVSGMKTPGSELTGIKNVLDVLYHLALPTICLIFANLAGVTRYTRASMIDALNLDCIRTARAKGLKEKVVVYSHAWRNALVPLVSIIIGGFFGIVGGSIVLEQMFGFKGMGQLLFNATLQADYDLVMFLEVFYTLISLFANLVIDLAYGIVDPRVRISR